MKASDLLIKALEQEGVQYIFGIPGEENLDVVESLRTSSIKLILTRHEQAAGFMAATIGRLTGKPGVCLSTLGPGATNLMTAAAYAQLGGMPMVMITAQKPLRSNRQGRFQMVDVVELMRPVTKSSVQIADGSRVPSLVREAFRLAAEERPGAVHLQLPEDVAGDQVEPRLFDLQPTPATYPDPAAIDVAVEMICRSQRPLLLIGAGAARKQTGQALLEFVRKTGMPYFSTQMGSGVLDGQAPLCLGTAALSEHDYLHHSISGADLILSVGHDIMEKPPFLMDKNNAKVIHVNYTAASVTDVYFPHHQIVGDVEHSMKELAARICPPSQWDFSHYLKVKQHADAHIDFHSDSRSYPVLPQKVVADVRKAMPADGIVTLDNGVYKLWFSRNYKAHQPNTLLLDNCLATMGAGLPSAMAAKLLHPTRKVMAVCGDGGFMMNSQELETAVRLGLDLVVVILNDSAYGMIKWKQEGMGFPSWGLDFNNPDFVAYANAYGAHGHRIESTEELLPKLSECLSTAGVHVIDVRVDYSENERVLIEELKSRTCLIGEESEMPEMLQVASPYNRSAIKTLPLSDWSQVEAALVTARHLFERRELWLPPHQRIAILERLAALMEDRKQELIQVAVAEGGKPYVDTAVEVDRAIQGVKLGIQAIHKLHGEQVPMGLTAVSTHRLASTFWEPTGVVVSLSAFNHPLNLTVHQTVPAIAAGCPVIIKPASTTPMSCLNFVGLLQEAGLPQGWCQALLCNNQNAEKLATDSRVGYLSFIGSPGVGWRLRSKLAAGTRCALEHGGSAPVIVDSTADLEQAIPAIVKGGFYHAGQVCVSAKRIFVAQASIGTFAKLLKHRVEALKVGDPADRTTEVGPLIRPREVERVASWVDEAVAAGAVLLCGGKKLCETCYQPTVLLNPPEQVKVSTEEIFGPVLCLYSYQSLDEAIESSNRLPYHFQAAIFTRDLDTAMYAVERLNATAVMVNDHPAFRVDWMPFGGRDQSGLGMGGIFYSAREMSREKLMVIKSAKLQ